MTFPTRQVMPVSTIASGDAGRHGFFVAPCRASQEELQAGQDRQLVPDSCRNVDFQSRQSRSHARPFSQRLENHFPSCLVSVASALSEGKSQHICYF